MSTRPIRLVLFSDTHGNYWRTNIPDGDILIFGGDFSGFGTLDDLIDFNAFLGGLPHRYKLMIAGNHDFCFQDHPRRSRELLTNAKYLQDSGVPLMGLRFYGTPWQPWFMDWAFNLRTEKELKEKWDLIPTDTDVLITHGPPRGYGDMNARKERLGDAGLLDAIKRVKPRICVFGHIHEGYGKWTIGKTRLYNVSVCNENNQLAHAPTKLELSIERKKAEVDKKTSIKAITLK